MYKQNRRSTRVLWGRRWQNLFKKESKESFMKHLIYQLFAFEERTSEIQVE